MNDPGTNGGSDGGDAGRNRPFELEPEPERAPAPPPPVRSPASRPPPEVRAPREPSEGEEGVDPRTLAERRGETWEPTRDALAPPPDWPVEAFRFPLRGDGVWMIAGWGFVWLLLDLLSWWNLFVGALLKIMALAFFFRSVLYVAGMSAAGRDEPEDLWRRTADVSAPTGSFMSLLLQTAAALAPCVIALLMGNTVWAIVLGTLGAMWVAVVLLGTALGDAALAMPWNALPWIVRHPLPLLAGGAFLWVLALTEAVVLHTAGVVPFALALFLYAILRAAFLYVSLLSARILGVLGRSWTLDGIEEPEPEGDEG